MPKIYGNRKSPKEMPSAYNQSTELVLYKSQQGSSAAEPTAWGRWTIDLLLLKYGSLVIGKVEDEACISNIKDELEKDEMLEFNDKIGDYSLKGDIYLHSPSTAGRLVNARTSNGFEDWKNTDGIKLGHIAWPDDPDCF